jgi:hypothetical protein
VDSVGREFAGFGMRAVSQAARAYHSPTEASFSCCYRNVTPSREGRENEYSVHRLWFRTRLCGTLPIKRGRRSERQLSDAISRALRRAAVHGWSDPVSLPAGLTRCPPTFIFGNCAKWHSAACASMSQSMHDDQKNEQGTRSSHERQRDTGNGEAAYGKVSQDRRTKSRNFQDCGTAYRYDTRNGDKNHSVPASQPTREGVDCR